ncbi:integrase, catalytic region, zinc finger, CCHC-type containing protein [Tanacetum coccineum]
MMDNVGKKVICYNCHGEGHVSRQCKEKKRVKDSQYFKDKMLHEDAYDSDVDEGPHAAAAFMANLSSTSGTNGATTSQNNLDSDVESILMTNDSESVSTTSQQSDVLTEIFLAPPDEISMITILDDLRTQLEWTS